MIRYITGRLLQAAVALVGVVSLLFVILRLVPGDPAGLILGIDATDAEYQAMRDQLGLDQPIPVQYWNFMVGMAQLDFGQSYRLGGDALAHVLDRFPSSALLAVVAMVLALGLSLPLGMAASRRPGHAIDRLVSVVSLLGQSLPNFWIGIMLILIFARTLDWLPVAGNQSPAHYILPSITLALPLMGVLTRLTRSGFIQEMQELYAVTARSKGLSEGEVRWKHAARNTLIPVVTVAGLQLGSILGGAIIVETVFSWPGVGRLLVDAVLNRDYPVIQACVALIAVIFLVTNLLVDLAYSFLDPRIQGAR